VSQPDDALQRAVDEVGAEVEADPAIRLTDRLLAQGVKAALAERDPVLDDHPMHEVIDEATVK
jgi:hypothetical protein